MNRTIRRGLHTLITTTVGAVMLACAGHAWAQKANECLETTEDGKVTRMSNVCGLDISVAYCALAKPSVVPVCGSQANRGNPYYTNMRNLKPGERADVSASKLATAVCLGKINAWATKGFFKAEADGRFECLQPSHSAQPDDVIGTAATREAACKLASASADQKDDGVQPVCECAALKSGRVFVCKAAKESAELDLLNAPGWLLRFIHWKGEDIRTCDPERDPNKCVRTFKQPSIGIGSRG